MLLKTMFTPADFFDLDHTEHRVIFENVEYVWQALSKISAYLQFRLKPAILGNSIGKPFISNAVFVGKGTVIEHGAMIKGPAWIGENCEIRNGCYIRENVIIGAGPALQLCWRFDPGIQIASGGRGDPFQCEARQIGCHHNGAGWASRDRPEEIRGDCRGPR